MSFWSWLTQPFAVDRGFMVRDGKELRWHRASFPLPIWYTNGAAKYAHPLVAGARRINELVGERIFMLPDPVLVPELLESYGRDPRAMKSFVLVCDATEPLAEVVGLTTVVISDHDADDGHAVIHYDKRSGEIRNVVIVLSPGAGAAMDAAVMHELGHAVGLDHDVAASSIMCPRILGRPGTLSAADARRLRAAYRGA